MPEGELDFPLSGLRMTPAGGFWTGAVRYGGTPSFRGLGEGRGERRAARVVVALEALQSGPADRRLAITASRRSKSFPSPRTACRHHRRDCRQGSAPPDRAGTPIVPRGWSKRRRPLRAAIRCRSKSNRRGATSSCRAWPKRPVAPGKPFRLESRTRTPLSRRASQARAESRSEGNPDEDSALLF